MVEQVVVESKPLLPEGKPQAALSPAKDGRQVSVVWLPLAALFGALCTLAVVSVALSGPNGWWLGVQTCRRHSQQTACEELCPCRICEATQRAACCNGAKNGRGDILNSPTHFAPLRVW